MCGVIRRAAFLLGVSLDSRNFNLTACALHGVCTPLSDKTTVRACCVMLHPSFMIQVYVESSGLGNNVFAVRYDGGAKRGASSKVS
jgi:hypothetical protein